MPNPFRNSFKKFRHPGKSSGSGDESGSEAPTISVSTVPESDEAPPTLPPRPGSRASQASQVTSDDGASGPGNLLEPGNSLSSKASQDALRLAEETAKKSPETIEISKEEYERMLKKVQERKDTLEEQEKQETDPEKKKDWKKFVEHCNTVIDALVNIGHAVGEVAKAAN